MRAAMKPKYVAINMDNVEYITSAGQGLLRVHFVSGNDILTTDGERATIDPRMKNWEETEIVHQRTVNTGPM